MKLILITLAVISAPAFAAQTQLELREPALRASNPAIDCFNRTGNLNTRDAAILCSGAVDAFAPINCFNSTGSLSDHDAAILCSRSGVGTLLQ